MSTVKMQAFEVLKEIPDEKAGLVLEILIGLRMLFESNEKSTEVIAKDAMGIFSKYANPNFIRLEKDAWGEAMKEKHAAH